MKPIVRCRRRTSLAGTLALVLPLFGCDMTGGPQTAGTPTAPDPLIQSGQIVGGATKQITTDVRPVAGFLPEPELLRRGAPGQAALVYINPNARLAAYNKVWLDPVTVWAAPDSALNAVPPAQREALANSFYADLYGALKKVCQMTNRREAGTMHLRFAVVDAKVPNATVNTIATYAPYASSAYSVASLAFNKGVGLFAGTATAEGFATDAVNGTLLWEGVDKRGGTTALVENTFDTWLDVHHAFEAWSARLAARMKELGACQQPPTPSAAPRPKKPAVKR